jgi:cardiolipin synthase
MTGLKGKTKSMMLILIPLLLQKEIVIVGSYFLPGRRMNNALKKRQKQVKVKLILAGISDVTFQTTHHIYAALL